MFITFEGPDGSGKTTQIHKLIDQLEKDGRNIVFTREPGGTKISDQVREVLMNMENKQMFPRTETLLFCSARAQLVEEVIRPALKEGKVVISDRYVDSTLAYQGYGHGFDQNLLIHLLNFTTGNLWPDLTILLDIPSEKGLQRRIVNKEDWNRLDDYQLEFHKRVRAGYLKMAGEQPDRWKVINADRPVEVVYEEISQVINSKLKSESH